MQPLNLPYHSIAGYHLTQQLGSGGMGDVYKAWHPGLQRIAAIKILHQSDMMERFKNEAYIQARVNHPNIARLYEFTSAGNKPCIIMEYVEGESLDSYLQKNRRPGNAETVAIVQQILSALEYLHSKQILHRDIKPQNFRIQPDGTIKMLDFGIAKHKYSPKFTREGFIVGTTEYMAPEQFGGKAVLKSDIWSLGVMTYEMLTGSMPFDSSNMAAQLHSMKSGQYTRPVIINPSVSRELAGFVERSLTPDLRTRPTAGDLSSGLTGKSTGPIWKIITRKLQTYKKPLTIAGAVIIVFMLLSPFTGSDPAPLNVIQPGPIKNNEQTYRGDLRKLRINVPGVEGASVRFTNDSSFPAPHMVQGRDGELLKFTIQAAGYRDKEVEIELRMGPQTYDFILEKIN